LNGTAIDGATGQTYDANESGAYQVTAVNGCLSTSTSFNAIISGLHESSQHAMVIYPNPAEAMSDGPNAVPLQHMKALLETLLELDAVTKKNPFLENNFQ